MNELQRSAILLSLIENLKTRGSWCGETHIQKATYLLQELMEVPLGFNFILYKYGPYSFDLSEHIVSMRADSLIRLISNYPYGPTLAPGELVEQVKGRCLKTLGKFEAQVAFAANQLGEKRVADLEALSTALYIYLNESETSPEGRIERLKKIKPHIDTDLATSATKDLDDLFVECRPYLHSKTREQAIV